MYQVIQNEEMLINWLEDKLPQLCTALINKQIKDRLLQSVRCLDDNYGKDRNLKSDLGGFVIILFGDSTEVQREYEKIMDYFGMDRINYEYEDSFQEPECLTKVTFRLYLCSSDYAVEVVTIYE